MAEKTEFQIQVNIGDTGPVDVMMEDPSDGPHKVNILDVRLVTKEGENGKTTLRFSVTDIEPGSPTLGVQTSVTIGTDFAKPFNKGHLVNSLLSIGAAPEKIKGTITLNPAVWRGRDAYIIVKAPPEGEMDDQGRRKLANKNFLTPSQYEAAKRTSSMRVNAPRAAPDLVVTAPTPIAPIVTAPVVTTPQVISPTVTPASISVPPNSGDTATAIQNLFS